MSERPDVERILTMDQDVVDDPYPLAAVLRRECPVFREPHYNVLVVTRYDDLIDVARRPQDFSSILAAYGPSRRRPGPGTGRALHHRAACRRSGSGAEGPGGRAPGRIPADLQDQLQHVDPPLHTRHRRIVNRWFSPRAVAVREDDIRATATLLIDRFAAGGRVEILDALAGPLPATVIADIIGIPGEHRALFLDWKEEVFGNPDAEVSRATSPRYQRIREVFLTFIEDRRARAQPTTWCPTWWPPGPPVAKASTTRPCSACSCCSSAAARRRRARRSPARCACSVSAPGSSTTCGRRPTDFPTSSRRCCASSHRCGASSASPPATPASATSRFPRVRSSN